MESITANPLQQLARALAPGARVLSLREEDWRTLATLAARHGVRPLLYRAAKNGAAPPYVLAELRAFALENARRNLAQTAELLRVLDALAASSVDALAFKGPTLAALVFGDVGMREFGDLDLLIAKDDFTRASSVLRALGYEPQMGGTSAAQAILDAYRVVAFSHTTKDITVELHWELAPQFLPFPADFAQLRANALLVETAGRCVPTLPREELLLYLCNHGAKHHWESLAWVADLAWLIADDAPPDWARVLSRADALGSRRVLLVGVRMACELCGLTTPPLLGEALRRDRAARRLAARATDWLVRDVEPGVIEWARFFTGLRDGWRGRLASAYHLLAAPNLADWEFVRLPRAMWMFYPVVRLVRVLARKP